MVENLYSHNLKFKKKTKKYRKSTTYTRNCKGIVKKRSKI